MTDTQPGCGWINSFGKRCDKSIDGEVVLRDRLMAGAVLVCEKHQAEYNRNAAAVRVNSRTRRSGPPTMRKA